LRGRGEKGCSAGARRRWAARAACARERGKRGRRPDLLHGLKKKRKKGEMGRRKRRPAGPEERKGEGFGVFFLKKFFSNSFSNFANFTQTIKPRIRIMMHKQLLFLILLK
jgi:hypothetical protein